VPLHPGFIVKSAVPQCVLLKAAHTLAGLPRVKSRFFSRSRMKIDNLALWAKASSHTYKRSELSLLGQSQE
jgi:hypothetical protein